MRKAVLGDCFQIILISRLTGGYEIAAGHFGWLLEAEQGKKGGRHVSEDTTLHLEIPGLLRDV